MFDALMNRREFIKEGTLSLAAVHGALSKEIGVGRSPKADDVVRLGRSKLLASRQSLGLGDGQAEAFQKMGQAGFSRLIRHALDKGVRYFDLLPGPSHEMLAEALKGVPRESYTLVTNFRHPEEHNPAKMIERFLKELRTDYLDGVLAGAILTRDWATEDKWAEHSGYREASNPAEERLKAIRYVLALKTIDTMPIQCESIREFDEVTAMINRVGSG